MKRACSLQNYTQIKIHMRVPSGFNIKLITDEE